MQARRFLPIRVRGQMVLPADIRNRHHLDVPGAQVELVERPDGVIELHPLVPVPADQAWFWEPDWQEGERRVDEHVAAGDVSVSGSIDDFLDELDAVRQRSRPA